MGYFRYKYAPHNYDYKFAEKTTFNGWVNIPDSVRTARNTFRNCTNLNSPVVIGNNVENCIYMFYNCQNYNQGVTSYITLSNSITNCYRMFFNCISYDARTSFRNSGDFDHDINIDQMFFNCINLRQEVFLPKKSVKNLRGVFYNCTNFNRSGIYISESAINCYQMFYGCTNFNQLVNIPDNVKNTAYMFTNCTSLNKPINIPNNVETVTGMFMYCNNLNSVINIGNNVTSAYYLFYGCYNFNQPVILPENIVSLSDTFTYCYNLNQNIVIPASVTTTCRMFMGCKSFDQTNWVLPYTIENAQGMFQASNFRKISLYTGYYKIIDASLMFYYANIHITDLSGIQGLCGNNLENAAWMFRDSTFHFPSGRTTIYIYGNNLTNASFMFYNANFNNSGSIYDNIVVSTGSNFGKNLINASYMFYFRQPLSTGATIQSGGLSNLINGSHMFDGLSLSGNDNSLKLLRANFDNLTDASYMFANTGRGRNILQYMIGNGTDFNNSKIINACGFAINTTGVMYVNFPPSVKDMSYAFFNAAYTYSDGLVKTSTINYRWIHSVNNIAYIRANTQFQSYPNPAWTVGKNVKNCAYAYAFQNLYNSQSTITIYFYPTSDFNAYAMACPYYAEPYQRTNINIVCKAAANAALRNNAFGGSRTWTYDSTNKRYYNCYNTTTNAYLYITINDSLLT